ncbi:MULTISPECIES: hypothetical protein [Streptomyces]|uniref:Uncharacterized protein n=1 Tax=Streptomyces spororaveus TaxID=284039 RepID=A0ABQ3TG70_9ACTN|nr:hypothetical protein [Streptomyces spororaveus]MCM9080269.1 hypothetical protein [Streptomyces spororaveus]GHI79407.1 hypothetical protein Sspor_49680 [Streptomyces spororaveus]
MSDSAIIVAELTVPAREAPARAAATAAWLLDQGVIRPEDRPDPLWRPSPYVPGPAAQAALADRRHAPDDAVGDGVDLLDQRRIHHPGGNYTPPGCPHCAVPLDEDAHTVLIRTWFDREEPLVTCAHCGAAALLGDWTGQWAVLVSHLAVRFTNWPPLGDAFLRELHTRLGPRCRLIHHRL